MTDEHERALYKARQNMNPYRGLNKARDKMKKSLNAHKDALAKAKGKMR